MADPDIKFYDSTDTTEYTSLDYGSIDAGNESSVITLHIWNDKGGSLGSSTAENCVIRTVTSTGAYTGLDLVEEKWFNSKCTSYGATTYTAIGGSTTETIGSTSGTDTIPSNAYASVDTKIVVPGTASSGSRSFKTRVSYTFT